MPTTTTGSPNIAILDSKIIADLCIGKFYIDITPSTFIGDGADNVLGANVQITNPAGVIVKPYGANYEIAPGLSAEMEAVISYNVPTIASNYMYGTYKVSVQLFDADGTEYVIEKSVTICEPDSKNKTRKYGTLSAKLKGNCKNGKLAVMVDGVPNYRGKQVQSQVNDLELEYPTSSGVDVEESTYGSFSVVLYEGVYKLTGTICALYNLGDNVFAKINYKIKVEKNIKCIIDLCCINTRLASLQTELDEGCGADEKANLQSTILQVLNYVKLIELAAECGEDPSDYVTSLENLIGCTCTCNCNEGTPILEIDPTTDVVIEGCNVTSETVGLTTTYTINNYEYVITVAANGGVLTVTSASQDGCTKTQNLTLDIAKMYEVIKAQINNATEYAAWAQFINQNLNGLNITCLGITTQAWALMTFRERIQAIINALCTGGSCDATITTHNVTQNGSKLEFTFTTVSAGYMDIFINGLLVGTVDASIGSFTYDTATGASDDATYDYALISKCKNGSQGGGVSGTVTVGQTPYVAPPQVITNHLQGTCPYDLTTVALSVPLGIVTEWHNANNTLASSLVPNPTSVMGGTYFLFAKDSNNFYSTGVMVTLVCDLSGTCSGPQNLQVIKVFGANQVQFQSAAYPPPLNSYTVKRKLASDPDVAGSYTTIGTPTWNPSASRWIIADNSAVQNVLYTYRAISNCSDTAPYIDTTFADISCPVLSLVPTTDDIQYSFAPVGGEITKYEVTIYDNNGSIAAIHTNTHLPSFTNPLTGFFIYLDPSTTYYVGVKLFIGTYSKKCPLEVMQTADNFSTLVLDYVAGIWSATLTNPLAQDIKVSGAQAEGSNDDCATAFETDSMPELTIEGYSLGAEEETGGLSYLSEKYAITDAILVKDAADNAVYEGAGGDTFVLDGITVTVQINHTTCGYYPA